MESTEWNLGDNMGIELDHIGIAVRNLEERTPFWIALGLIQGDDESLPLDGVNARFLSTNGESNKPVKVELLEPLSSDSPIGRFIDRHGEGIQQIAFRVDDINSTISKLVEHGVEMIDIVVVYIGRRVVCYFRKYLRSWIQAGVLDKI